jgi:hypothetical protein
MQKNNSNCVRGEHRTMFHPFTCAISSAGSERFGLYCIAFSLESEKKKFQCSDVMRSQIVGDTNPQVISGQEKQTVGE